MRLPPRIRLHYWRAGIVTIRDGDLRVENALSRDRKYLFLKGKNGNFTWSGGEWSPESWAPG